MHWSAFAPSGCIDERYLGRYLRGRETDRIGPCRAGLNLFCQVGPEEREKGSEGAGPFVILGLAGRLKIIHRRD
jgi:hypothetical protein